MSSSDDIRNANEKLRIRIAEFRRIGGKVMQLMESGGKPAVITYLCKELEADAVEQGSDVLIGSQIIRFDDYGNFPGMESDPSQTATAIKKPPPSSGSSGGS